MKDYTQSRDQIYKNYLQNMILRIDFEDIIEFDKSTEKSFTTYLRSENFDRNIGILNEFSLMLNNDIVTIEDTPNLSISSDPKEIFVFHNDEHKIKIEISPFFIVINKYAGFDDNYRGFEYYSNLLFVLLEILKDKEQIMENRLGLRKIDGYQNNNLSKFRDIFDNFVVNDFYTSPFTSTFQNFSKRFSFKEKNYVTNYQIVLQKGVVYNSDNLEDIYQLQLDIDIIKNSSINFENIKQDLKEMNDLLFNAYMNSYKENIIQDYILKNKNLF